MSIKHTLSAVGVLILISALIFLGSNSRQTLAGSEVKKPLVGMQNSASEVADADLKTNDLKAKDLKTKLEDKLPGIEISDISPSPHKGFYQVFFSGQLLYVSTDGQYVFTGNLLELAEAAPINHSQDAIEEFESRQAPQRAQVIADIAESDMVVFKAPEEKHIITVFTDVDCAYCRKLHREVPQLNKNGVTVRYMAYPRAGIGSDAYRKLVSVWCADDRMAAMDDAKLKRKFSDRSCTNPIASQFKLTREFNLSGTPALILEDGELIGGYVPFADLVGHLEQKSKAGTKTTTQVSSGK